MMVSMRIGFNMTENPKIYKVVAIEKATGNIEVIAEDLTRDAAQTMAVKMSYESNKFLYKVTK